MANLIQIEILFYLNKVCHHPPEEPNGETVCWGHFNDFIGFSNSIGVSLLLTGSDLTLSSSLFGWQQKKTLISIVVMYVFKFDEIVVERIR